jgi:hypothetical protein
VDHTGEPFKRKRSARKRGERSSNPHGVKREKFNEGE